MENSAMLVARLIFSRPRRAHHN